MVSNFDPGSSILFQAGGTWRGRLSATSSGTPDAPITYSSYGTGPKPTFYGSDVLDKSSFSLVPGTSSTYVVKSSAPVGSVLGDGLFLNNAWLKNNRTANTTTNLNYVNSTPNSYYYDSASSNLYLNTGGALTQDPRQLTAVTRDDVVLSFTKKNLVFDNFVVKETAVYDAGYAFRIQNGINVKVTNCEAYNAGKHHFGAINSTGFVGDHLKAAGAMPDQGYGGASALVSYADGSGFADGWIRITNATSVWSNVEIGNLTDPSYPAFLSHGPEQGPITLSNIASTDGASMSISSKTTATDITVVNNGVGIGDATINRLRITGRNASLSLWGNAVVSNALIAPTNGVTALNVLYNNNTVQFSTIVTPQGHSGVLINLSTGDFSQPAVNFVGNVFAPGSPVTFVSSGPGTGLSPFVGDYNVYAPNVLFQNMRGGADLTAYTAATGNDAHSLQALVNFISAATGDYSLVSRSPGTYFIPASLLSDPTFLDLLGNARTGSWATAGAFTANYALVPEPATIAYFVAAAPLVLNRRRTR